MSGGLRAEGLGAWEAGGLWSVGGLFLLSSEDILGMAVVWAA